MSIDPGLAALLVLALLATGMTVANISSAANGHANRAATLAEFLETPEHLARVWYQKPDVHCSGDMYIWAKHTDGRKLLLGVPRDASEVWSQLQGAGIVVHSSPGTESAGA